ncbi:General secretion pathway protein F/type IV pilus assembly protein PilC [Planctomycetales bacterium 10988]|nr:General secretion pathway protein F/type IV pilus assembly protein PilC [Planctomycetales bacterium 10988]
MPDFAYIARDASGKKITGLVTATNRRDALTQLDQKALFPLEVTAQQSTASLLQMRRVRPALLATTYAQLADLLRGGVPMLRSLKVLEKQTRHARLREVLLEIRKQVEEGSTLADAMARHPRVFGELAVSIVRAGGEGGFLEDALEQIASFTEKQEDLKSRVTGAIAYPAFLGIVGVLVVTGLMIFLVPQFESLFANLRDRGELPLLTEGLLAVSAVMQSYGLFMLGGLVILFFVVQSQLQTERGRRFSDYWKLKIPIVGKIFLNLAVSRFCRVLGTLLKNGVPILRSLQIASDSTGNRVLSTAIQHASENISSGESLATPLTASRLFPTTVTEMIAVAEESNTLEKVLLNVADGMDRRTWRQLELAVRLLEPLLLLILAVAVLLIVLSLLLPIVKMSMTVG